MKSIPAIREEAIDHIATFSVSGFVLRMTRSPFSADDNTQATCLLLDRIEPDRNAASPLKEETLRSLPEVLPPVIRDGPFPGARLSE